VSIIAPITGLTIDGKDVSPWMQSASCATPSPAESVDYLAGLASGTVRFRLIPDPPRTYFAHPAVAHRLELAGFLGAKVYVSHAVTIQNRFPRSKRRRIRKKWAKRPSNREPAILEYDAFMSSRRNARPLYEW